MIRSMRVLGTLLTVCVLWTACRPVEEPTYTFSLDGEPIRPQHYSLEGDPSRLKPGDVIAISVPRLSIFELFLTLGKERACHFVTGEGREPLLLRTRAGKPKVVAAIVGRDNPLAGMSRAEIRDLWGLRLTGWPQRMTECLAHVDPNRTCVTITGSFDVAEQRTSLASLCARLRYLAVQDIRSAVDYAFLGDSRHFLFLAVKVWGSELDLEPISHNADLRHLDVQAATLRNTEALSALTGLRSLRLNRCQGVDDIGFATTMDQLRVLQLYGTKLSSLAPLADSRSIREIDVRKTDVNDLPTGELPSLRTINIIATKVEAEAAARFRETHPDCVVHYNWTDSLHEAIRDADRLRVISGIEGDPNKVRFETTDPNDVERLMACIEVEQPKSGGIYRFEGHPILEFSRDDHVLAILRNIPRAGLRWEDGPWPGDATLTRQSASALADWFEEQGISLKPY